MDDSDIGRWDELHPDALELIFRSLSLEEILVTIPCVCKSWRDTVLGPYCWQEIDIMDWSEYEHPNNVNRMFQMLITRTAGSLRKLCVGDLPNHSNFLLIAQHGQALHTLRLPRSEITNSILEHVVQRISALTFLDLSFCRNIRAPALEAIGKHCVNLTSFLRVVYSFLQSCEDDEAVAVASTMHKLKHLEIANWKISTELVLMILKNCPELEYLDVRGCRNVIIDEKFQKFSRVKLVGPLREETYEWDHLACYSSLFSNLTWYTVADDADNCKHEISTDI